MNGYMITDARIYVSTRKRCESGNRFGIWVELADFGSRRAYMDHCKGLFTDEPEPLIVHLEWQDLPLCLINENAIAVKVFKLIAFAKMMEQTQQKGFCRWLARQQQSIFILKAQEIVNVFTMLYMGYFGNMRQFAFYYAEETMGISTKRSPRFDFTGYACRLFSEEFIIDDGFVFRRNTIGI